MTADDFCFVYVAVGAPYVEEAARSARSLRRFHREPAVLVTNAACAPDPFDEVLVLPELPSTIEAKLSMDAVRHRKFLYLDSDTTILAPLDEIIRLLDVFDVCVPAALGGYHYELPGVSPAFREPATNVVGVRKSEAGERFFRNWRKFFKEYETVMDREWDQRSFRHAAYVDPELRVCFLGDEWSLSPYPGGILCRDVRILHGRPAERLATMAATVNRRLGYRVYWQDLPVIPDPATISFNEALSLAWSFLLLALKASIRPLRRRRAGNQADKAGPGGEPPAPGR